MNTIAEINDRFRRTLGVPTSGKPLGRVYITYGIQALTPEQQTTVAAVVKDFSDFTEENDPHEEHDFGAFTLEDVGRIFWKIDYYAPDMESHSEDPADLSKTVRVLTIMLASEY